MLFSQLSQIHIIYKPYILLNSTTILSAVYFILTLSYSLQQRWVYQELQATELLINVIWFVIPYHHMWLNWPAHDESETHDTSETH